MLMVMFTKEKFKSWKGKMTLIKKEKKILFLMGNKSELSCLQKNTDVSTQSSLNETYLWKDAF